MYSELRAKESMPLPSWPVSLLPQAMTVPLRSRARSKASPAETATAPETPSTVTGSLMSLVAPVMSLDGFGATAGPSSPSESSPQAFTLPFPSTARLWYWEVASPTASVTPLTEPGRGWGKSLPFPASPSPPSPQA